MQLTDFTENRRRNRHECTPFVCHRDDRPRRFREHAALGCKLALTESLADELGTIEFLPRGGIDERWLPVSSHGAVYMDRCYGRAVTVQFWFEFASTYTYPTAMRIEESAQRAGLEVEYNPFLLGPIFASQGWSDSPFNLYPAKGRYMWRDLERICENLGLPFRRPTVFPRSGLLAARVATVGRNEAWGPAFMRNVFSANFADDRDISSPDVLAAILESVGQDAASIFARAASPEIKQALRARTEAAQAHGIFGSPSFIVDEELFWGNDRLDSAIDWARGKR